MVNNQKYLHLLDIESDNGDKTIHMLVRNSSRVRRTILDNKNKDLLKATNRKSGISVSHLLAHDDQTACHIINSSYCKKELLRREHINRSSVAHWIARYSLKGSIAILSKLEYSTLEDKNFFKYVLRQTDNNNYTVMDTMKKRWTNNVSLYLSFDSNA